MSGTAVLSADFVHLAGDVADCKVLVGTSVVVVVRGYQMVVSARLYVGGRCLHGTRLLSHPLIEFTSLISLKSVGHSSVLCSVVSQNSQAFVLIACVTNQLLHHVFQLHNFVCNIHMVQ